MTICDPAPPEGLDKWDVLFGKSLVLPAKDRPIFLAAVEAHATHLLTGDRAHFGPYFGRNVMSRCFHAHCNVPKDQRNLWRASIFIVIGASVYAIASSAYTTFFPILPSDSVKS